MTVDQIATAQTPLDADKVEAFAGQVVTDVAATLASATMHVGHHAGLYGAMAEAEPLTVDDRPGHGLSDGPRGDCTVGEAIAVADAAIDHARSRAGGIRWSCWARSWAGC